MSYGIVKRLKEKNEDEVLRHLAEQVNATDQKKGYQDTVREVKSRLNRLKAGATFFLIETRTLFQDKWVNSSY